MDIDLRLSHQGKWSIIHSFLYFLLAWKTFQLVSKGCLPCFLYLHIQGHWLGRVSLVLFVFQSCVVVYNYTFCYLLARVSLLLETQSLYLPQASHPPVHTLILTLFTSTSLLFCFPYFKILFYSRERSWNLLF